jgi:hypothetical protein
MSGIKYQYYAMRYYVGFYVVNTSFILFIFYECQFVKHSKACFGFLSQSLTLLHHFCLLFIFLNSK